MTSILSFQRPRPKQARRIFWHRAKAGSWTLVDRYHCSVMSQADGAARVVVLNANQRGVPLLDRRAATRAAGEQLAERFVFETSRGRG